MRRTQRRFLSLGARPHSRAIGATTHAPNGEVIRGARFSRVCYGGGRRAWRPGPTRQRQKRGSERERESRAVANRCGPAVSARWKGGCLGRAGDSPGGPKPGKPAQVRFLSFFLFFFIPFSFCLNLKLYSNLNSTLWIFTCKLYFCN